MTDLPDWTVQQQQSGLRYVGAMAINFTPPSTGGQVDLDVTLAPLDRSLLIITPVIGATESLQVLVYTNDPGVVPAVQTVNLFAQTAGQVVVAYVNPDITTRWHVRLVFSSNVPEAYTVYVAADITFPVMMVAPGAGFPTVQYSPLGPQAELSSVSVVPSLNGQPFPTEATWPVGVSIASGSVGVTVAGADATVVAAPGVGHHLRVFAATLSVNRQVTGITDLTLLAGVGGTVIMRALALSTGGQPNVSFAWPAPYDLPDNTLLDCRMDGTIAGGFGVWLVYYTTI